MQRLGSRKNSRFIGVAPSSAFGTFSPPSGGGGRSDGKQRRAGGRCCGWGRGRTRGSWAWPPHPPSAPSPPQAGAKGARTHSVRGMAFVGLPTKDVPIEILLPRHAGEKVPKADEGGEQQHHIPSFRSRTAHTSYSGIFETGSCAAMVNWFADFLPGQW